VPPELARLPPALAPPLELPALGLLPELPPAPPASVLPEQPDTKPATTIRHEASSLSDGRVIFAPRVGTRTPMRCAILGDQAVSEIARFHHAKTVHTLHGWPKARCGACQSVHFTGRAPDIVCDLGLWLAENRF
jgi:hypothetical protein